MKAEGVGRNWHIWECTQKRGIEGDGEVIRRHGRGIDIFADDRERGTCFDLSQGTSDFLDEQALDE